MHAPSSAPERGVARRTWTALREWLEFLNGDTAYQRFVEHRRQHHPDLPIPSRAAFHHMETERRWNGVRRCC